MGRAMGIRGVLWIALCGSGCAEINVGDLLTDAPADAGTPDGDAAPGAQPVHVAAAADDTCAILASGAVACWGANANGQIGDGTTVDRHAPTAVVGLTDAVEVAPGRGHTCARRASGSVVCWGSNASGMLGDGTHTDHPTPTPVVGLTDAVQISVGGTHACARRASGAVVCWGGNATGQLGDGTQTDRSTPTPTPVIGLTDAVEVAAGGTYTCARRASGAVVCWGDNTYGEMGNGTTSAMATVTPTAVSLLTDAVELGVGGAQGLYTCARRPSGVVDCWGHTVNETSPTVTPAMVSDLMDTMELALGANHLCGRWVTGAVLCWGDNTFGQLGDGTMTGSLTTMPVSGLDDATEIASGANHACARRTTGQVVCWGRNDLGQLGDGTATQRLTPVVVAFP